MFTIRKSYGKCNDCRLINEPSCIMETNINDGLENCEILLLAENPGKDEVEAERPLVGQAGKIFRDPFMKYIKDNFKYIITNCVLCLTLKPDGKTGNPTFEDVDNCKENLFRLIETANPKVIFAMGGMAMYAFGLGKGGILSKAYQFHEWNGRKIYLTPHPSYIMRNGGLETEEGRKYSNAFKEVKEYLGKPEEDEILSFSDLSLGNLFDGTEEKNVSKTDTIRNKNEDKEVLQPLLNKGKTKLDRPFMFHIDPKFYTKDYRLEDIQYSSKFERVLFIFRDKNNKKILYELPKNDNNYYYYKSVDSSTRVIETMNNLQLVHCNYNSSRSKASNCYESDVDISAKHAIDYYIQSEGECIAPSQNIFFMDIEVYTFDDRSFPDPSKAEHPISVISFCLQGGDIETYLYKINGKIDPKIDKFLEDNKHLKISVFDKETTMLKCFVQRMHQLEPTILTAWNVSFDMGYIYNRMHRIGLEPRSLSKFDDCFIDAKSHLCIVSGYVVVDMMTIYKGLRQSTEESYSLEAVSQKILKKGKHKSDCPWWELYTNYIDDYITYNRMDVQLIVELNDTLRHIELMDELRYTATTNWKGVASTIGQVEGLFLTNLKKRGLAAKNRKENQTKGTVAGAFVKDPVGGKYDWIIDFDFASLYPNIVRSFNIGPNTYVGKIDQHEAFDIIYNRDKLDLEKVISYVEDPIHTTLKTDVKVKDIISLMDNGALLNVSGCLFKGHDEEKSIFFEIYNFLLETRKDYKKSMFKAEGIEKKVLDNKQWALKILANSMYGVLLNEYFRFYNQDLGYSITATGQEAIKFAGFHLNKYMDTGNYDFDPAFEKKVEDTLKYLLYVDTDSLFIKIGDYIKDKEGVDTITPDAILKTVAQIDPVLNKKIMDEYVKRHNIQDKYSYFALKQEIIADKVYFLNVKKRYALHVINTEGHSCDEMIIKGIETQRSDFSFITKEMLKTILNKVVLSEEVDIDEISDYVDERKLIVRDLVKKGHKDIGKPVSFAKSLSEYKTLSRAVRGMLLWNTIVYNTFVPGSRGVEYPILGIDIDKAPDDVKEKFYKHPYIVGLESENISLKDIKSIVIPESEDRLPNYFVPDTKAILKFAIDDRVELLLDPLFSRSTQLLSF